jgi:hypothetical protein
MPSSDKEILEVIFDAWDKLSALEDAIESGDHDDYFARDAKVEANNVSRFRAVPARRKLSSSKLSFFSWR